MADDPYLRAGARPARPVRTATAPAPTLREQTTLADLQGKYADMDIKRRQLDIDKARLDRLLATPLPEAPKPAVQKTREAMMMKRGEVIGEKAAAQEFALPKIEQSVARAFQSAKEILAISNEFLEVPANSTKSIKLKIL